MAGRVARGQSRWEDAAWSAVGLVTPVGTGWGGLEGAGPPVCFGLPPRRRDRPGTERPQREPRPRAPVSCSIKARCLARGQVSVLKLSPEAEASWEKEAGLCPELRQHQTPQPPPGQGGRTQVNRGTEARINFFKKRAV